MHWLMLATLGGFIFASTPPSDGTSARTLDALPRPSRPEIDRLLHAPERKVRSTHPKITKMLSVGAQYSSTFAGLLAALDRTDVIVYIEPVRDLPSTIEGRLVLLPLAHGQRYLRIQVRGDLPRDELIPLLGHELRHALEIADAPEVRDQSAMLALYRRIGEISSGPDSYDTVAAREAGKQVRAELLG
jgi:hypothetical protein